MQRARLGLPISLEHDPRTASSEGGPNAEQIQPLLEFSTFCVDC
jgi:hypothetical protein